MKIRVRMTFSLDRVAGRASLLALNCLLVAGQISFSEIGDVSHNCWRNVIIDSYVSSCFYSRNLTVEQDLSALMFYNYSYHFPGIFDPVYTAQTVAHIDNPEFYGSGSIPLHDGSTVVVYSLDMQAVTSAMSSDELLKQKVISFCGVRTFLRPVQDCIIHEISNAPTDNNFKCSSDELDSLKQTIKTSIVNYNIYEQFCNPVFSCSAHPIEECIRETAGDEANLNSLSLPSICLILSRVDTFTDCIKDKVWECHADEFSAYNSMIMKLKERAEVLIIDGQSLSGRCQMVTLNCQPDEGVANDLMLDGCYKRLYELGYGLVLSSADDPSSTLYTKSTCMNLKDAQACVASKASKGRCGQSVVAVIHEVVKKVVTRCDQVLGTSTTKAVITDATNAPKKTTDEKTTDMSDLIGALEGSKGTGTAAYLTSLPVILMVSAIQYIW